MADNGAQAVDVAMVSFGGRQRHQSGDDTTPGDSSSDGDGTEAGDGTMASSCSGKALLSFPPGRGGVLYLYHLMGKVMSLSSAPSPFSWER